MTIAEGHFQLYTHLTPPLKAGDYRFTATQTMHAHGPHDEPLGPRELPVEPLSSHVRVTSPRYQLPPDQVLSTYPPAGTEGAYGSRLPQVVIKRRTLPWEREVDPGHPDTPWLALVLVAENEAQIVLNAPVAECVTPGVRLGGPVDVDKGAYLNVRRSVLEAVLPTQKDIPLLAHAREVDIGDTELMMGDDDGFLAVVIANRLPLPGRDNDGESVPVKYLACLVNLEKQFSRLLPEAPEPVPVTFLTTYLAAAKALSPVQYDHLAMGSAAGLDVVDPAHDATLGVGVGVGIGGAPHAESLGATQAFARGSLVPDAVAKANAGTGGWARATSTGRAKVTDDDVYAVMAADFSVPLPSAVRGDVTELLDPVLRFPVLLHWSFTSTGQTTFRTLMEDLDSGLLGTVGEHQVAGRQANGRPPLEVVETGHVGLVHRTHRGDEVRSWYRGPLLPHPADTAADRIPLAHAADQLRAVVPDGREDISLATAFEIGRLLALSQPAMVAALLRWRQEHYQAAHRRSVWGDLLDEIGVLEGTRMTPDVSLSVQLGRAVARALAARPGDVLGQPNPFVTAGTPMEVDGRGGELIARGLGIDTDLTADLGTVLGTLGGMQVPTRVLADLPSRTVTALTRDRLRTVLDTGAGMLALDALGVSLADHPVLGTGRVVGPLRSPSDVPTRHTPDVLDRTLGLTVGEES